MKNKKFKRILYLLLFFLIIYFYSAGDYGFFQFVNKSIEKRNLDKEIALLEKENERLQKEKDMISEMNPDYIEKIAREKYGMVKKGEKVYRIVLKK